MSSPTAVSSVDQQPVERRRAHANRVSRMIIDAAMRVHTNLGPGLLASAYEAGLAYELRKTGLNVRTQVPMPLVYEGVRLDLGYRLDLLVDSCGIVELKAIEALAPIHEIIWVC